MRTVVADSIAPHPRSPESFHPFSAAGKGQGDGARKHTLEKEQGERRNEYEMWPPLKGKVEVAPRASALVKRGKSCLV